MSQTLKVLRVARDLITDPARWTRAAFARNPAGEKVSSLDPDAASWCAVGALTWASHRVGGHQDLPKAMVLIQRCSPGGDYLQNLNDDRGHAAVLAAFDAAIAAVSPGEGGADD